MIVVTNEISLIYIFAIIWNFQLISILIFFIISKVGLGKLVPLHISILTGLFWTPDIIIVIVIFVLNLLFHILEILNIYIGLCSIDQQN